MLRYKADRRTLGMVVLYFVATTLAWVYFPESWLLRIPIVIILCLLSFFCAVTVHNTIHQPIFKSKWANKIFQVVLSFTYGHSVSAFVSGHNFSHHQHTQKEMDRMRTAQMKYKWNFLNQFMLFFHMAPGIMKDEQLFAKKMYKERPNWFWQYIIELVLVIGVKIALVIYNPLLGFLLLVIPHIYASWGIVGTNFWQHDGCPVGDKYNHSRNFTSKILNFVAFNNGYHTAHHDQPHLHWSLLPAYHKEHIAPHIHPNLEQKSLFVYLWKTCVYPAKRLDYLGNTYSGDNVEYKDWLPAADIEASHNQLGIES